MLTLYAPIVPKLWNDTIEAHRREVTDAILQTTAHLVASGGVRSVTMSDIADGAGIGRATLYKYFPSVEAILLAWHERQVKAHLEQLGDVAARPGTAAERLGAVLETYALTNRGEHSSDLAALVHQGNHMDQAHDDLHRLIAGLIHEAANDGELRSDISPGELATFCVNALAAARSLPSNAAVRRLANVTMAGMRPIA